MRKPIVALVGRPNVGKSTLFNRLVGERMAIVDDTPGTTRDRLFGEAEWNGRLFHVVDTGGIDPTHGGKTPLSVGSADFINEIRQQAKVAIDEADAILFVNDGETGVTAPDLEGNAVDGLYMGDYTREQTAMHRKMLLQIFHPQHDFLGAHGGLPAT